MKSNLRWIVNLLIVCIYRYSNFLFSIKLLSLIELSCMRMSKRLAQLTSCLWFHIIVLIDSWLQSHMKKHSYVPTKAKKRKTANSQCTKGLYKKHYFLFFIVINTFFKWKFCLKLFKMLLPSEWVAQKFINKSKRLNWSQML